MRNKLSKIISILALTLFFALASNAQTKDDENKQKGEKQEKTNNSDSSKDCQSGVARLRVTFHKSGKITNVELVQSTGCKSLDNQAIEAAKKIKFTPKRENGEPATVTKTVEYTYSVYE